MYGQNEPGWVHKFRIYGLPICFLFYTYLFWLFYKNNIITNDSSKEFSIFQTLWIWILRISNWLMVPAFISFLFTIILYNPPPPILDDESQLKSKMEIPALILRIVTMGNYRSMVENSILYHIDLIKRYFNYDHFSIHLVTEKPINIQRSYPGLVKEIIVPIEYKTKSGSLGKARNLAYWSETNQIANLNEQKTWIIDMDEDVILTTSFMKSLCQKFLSDQKHPKIGLPQALIKFNDNANYLNKLFQSFRFPIDLVQHWPWMVLFGKAPAVCHGGCFIARADCSMDKNAECGPFCSISDDNAYILNMLSKGIQLEYMDGWFYEDAPNSAIAGIIQRARWQRGHLYLAWYSPVNWTRKLGIYAWCFAATFLLPFSALARLVFLVVAFSGKWGQFFPAGLERPYIGDLLTAAVLALYIFTLFYGHWFILNWKQALVYSIFALTGIPLMIIHIFDLMVAILVVFGMIKEMTSGKMTWNVTHKVEQKVKYASISPRGRS